LCFAAVLVRLFAISQPYVDAWSYKQGTVAMIAENFYRNGFNLFYPQINWAGTAPGYIGTEFPLVPFIAALLYVPFGVQEWIGRAVTLFSFTPSLLFFFLLVKRSFNARTAIFALVTYAAIPLSVFASRTFMSDMTSLSFSIMALYYSGEWLEKPDNWHLFFAGSLTIAFAILTKLPAVIIGFPILCMAWSKHGHQVYRQRKLWVFAAIALALPAAWYLHACLVARDYPPHQFAGGDGLTIMDFEYYAFIVRRLFTSSLTPIVAVAMLIGLVLSWIRNASRLFHWWLLALLVFIFVAGLGNRHPWYQLPAVPIAAAASGFALDLALTKLRNLVKCPSFETAATAAFFLALVTTSYFYLRPLYDPWAIPLQSAGHEIDRLAPADALVIFVLDGDSSGIYYSKHKGWHAFDANVWGAPLDSAEAITGVERLRKNGASYIVFTQYTAWWLDYYEDFGKYLDSRYRRVRATDDYVIYDLAHLA
jgi:4-amino-4-deoxy-L-arabinose transferase-like glycosyltransferase